MQQGLTASEDVTNGQFIIEFKVFVVNSITSSAQLPEELHEIVYTGLRVSLENLEKKGEF